MRLLKICAIVIRNNINKKNNYIFKKSGTLRFGYKSEVLSHRIFFPVLMR